MTIKTTFGYNMSSYAYYNQAMPFCNRLKCSSNSWTFGGVASAYQDAHGNYVGVPSGTGELVNSGSVYAAANDNAYSRLLEGGYNILSNGTLQFNAGSWYDMIIDGSAADDTFDRNFKFHLILGNPGAGVVEYTPSINITSVANTSGSTWHGSDMALVHDDDMVDFKAGYITTRRFRDFHKHTRSMRFMEVFSGSVSSLIYSGGALPYWTASQYPVEADNAWTINADGTTVLPYGAVGRIATELGLTQVHIAVDSRLLDPSLAISATPFYTLLGLLIARAPANLIVKVEVTNELWNSTAKQSWFAKFYDDNGLIAYNPNGTVNGSPSSNDKAHAALGYLSARAWRIAETLLGTSRVVRLVMGQQNAFSAGASSTVLQYLDPVSGSRVGTLCHEAGSAPYVEYYAGSTATDPYAASGVQITSQGLCEQEAYSLWTVAQWKEALITNHITPRNLLWFTNDLAWLAANFPNVGWSNYEGGMATQQFSQANLATGFQCGYAIKRHGADDTFELQTTTDVFNLGYGNITNGFRDGEQIQVMNLGVAFATLKQSDKLGGTTASGYNDNQTNYGYVKVVSGRLRIFATLSDYNNDLYCLSSSGGSDGSANARPTIQNYTRMNLLDAFLKNVRATSVGVALEVALYNMMKGKATVHHQFQDVAGWDHAANSWGVMRSYDESAVNVSIKVHRCINYKRSTNTANLNGPFV